MATDSAVQKIGSLTASVDLSAAQYKGVKMAGATRTVTVIALATDKFIGILQNKPTAGQPADIAIGGEVMAMAGAAFAAGTELMFDTSGRVITAVTTGNRVIGLALEDAGAINQIVSILPHVAERLLP